MTGRATAGTVEEGNNERRKSKLRNSEEGMSTEYISLLEQVRSQPTQSHHTTSHLRNCSSAGSISASMSASRSNLLPRLSKEEGRNKSKSNHVKGD